VEDQRRADAQLEKIEEAGGRAGQQRSFRDDTNLGAAKRKRSRVKHVGGEIQLVVIDTHRGQVGKVVGLDVIVERGVEGVLVPLARRVGRSRDRQQERRRERVGAPGNGADKEAIGVIERHRVGDEIPRLNDGAEEVLERDLRDRSAVFRKDGGGVVDQRQEMGGAD